MTVQIRTDCFEAAVQLLILHDHNGETVLWGVEPATYYPIFQAAVLGQPPEAGCVWLRGWDENAGLPESLAAAGVVALTGRTRRVGCHEAREARLLFND